MKYNELFETETSHKGLPGFMAQVEAKVTTFASSATAASIGKNVINIESIAGDTVAKTTLRETAQDLLNSITSFATESFGVVAAGDKSQIKQHGYSNAQLKAATIAAMMGHNVKEAIDAPTQPLLSIEGVEVVSGRGGIPYARRASTESYDQSSITSSITNSIGFNLEAAGQGPLAEAFFPTVVIPPNESGMFVSIDQGLLMDDAKRNINGAITNFNRVNVIRAQVYPELLNNDATDLVPVVRDDSKHLFVDEALLAPITRKMDDGSNIVTSALKIGAKFDLMALSHTDVLASKGLPDLTDPIDTGVMLDEIFVKIGDGASAEVIKFKVKELSTATYYAAQQGDWRDQVLSFENSSLKVDKNVTKADGTASTLLAPLVSGAYEARLSIQLSGKLNLQFGTGSVYGPPVEISTLSKAGVLVSTTAGPGAGIAALFDGAEVVGYTLAAKRANLNKRQRGQVIDTNTKKTYYALNLLAPITAVRPHGAGDANDARDLSFLIYTCKTRSTIDAIEKIQETAALLKSMKGEYHRDGETTETFGMARFLLDPYYAYDHYIAPTVVDSIKSHERAEDIQASLVNLIRDHVFKMWQLSAYGPASASQNGGKEQIPTVLIACDPRIEQYLNITGDLRLLGDKFPVKVVSDVNKNLRGKLYISFGNMETAAAGVVNVLHFGTTMFRPEMTMILPISRDGQTSREITVSPAFRHIVHLPLMIEMDVEGIEDVVNAKLPIVTKDA